MDETLQLRNQVCFAVYAASRALTSAYRPLLDELGLTYPQYIALLVLWERDGRTVSALGEALQLDSGTLSPLLKRLQTAGLLERRRDDADERRVTVHLTEAGAALRERAQTIPARIAEAAGLSIDELRVLHDALTNVTTNLRGRQ